MQRSMKSVSGHSSKFSHASSNAFFKFGSILRGGLIPVKIKFDVKRKKVDYKTAIECGKRCQNIFIGLKKDLFGCFK